MVITRLRRGLGSGVLLIGLVLALGACSSNKVWVKIPPARDLSGYERIGLIEFTGNDASLAPIATREFQQRLHAAQPGVRIVELGEEAWVRGSVGAKVLDGAAFMAIAEEHDVDAIFMGELAVENAVPRLDIMASLIEVRGSIDVTADLHVRLIEPRGGATVWSRSSSDSMTIASADVLSTGTGTFSMRDPESVYGPMMANLAAWTTTDFRPHYVRRKIEQVPPYYVIEYVDGDAVYAPPPSQTASAELH